MHVCIHICIYSMYACTVCIYACISIYNTCSLLFNIIKYVNAKALGTVLGWGVDKKIRAKFL